MAEFDLASFGITTNPTGETLEQSRLQSTDLQGVMDDLGRFLSRLHSIHPHGFGPLDAGVGTYASWYEFLVSFFNDYSRRMDETQQQEQETGQFVTDLSANNRQHMNFLLGKREQALLILEEQKDLLEIDQGSLLNGDIHCGSMVIQDGKFVGLNDWGQMLSGDPVDDLAYLSIMPGLDYWYPRVAAEWQRVTREPHFSEKFHLYRLFESYRKIFTRYLKHHYLNDYPQPLYIATAELSYYNI